PLTTLPSLTTLSLNRNPLDNTSFTQSIPTLTSKVSTFTFDADQAPVIQPFTVATATGTPVTVTVPTSDPDAGDTAFLTSASTDNANVAVQLVGNQLTLTPAAGFNGIAHITVNAVDGASGALDWRGRSTSRIIDFVVGSGAITGFKFGDSNNNGIRDPGEAGVLNWTVFLDTNKNGILDAGETS